MAMIGYHSTAQTAGGPEDRIEGFTDSPMLPGGKWHQHDPNRPQPPVVTPGSTFSQGAPPPSDAEVLFDGKDLSKWEGGAEKNPNWKDQPASWTVRDGYAQVAPPDGTDIRTRGRWSDFQLHVEWTTPDPPTGHGQARGNSGVFLASTGPGDDGYELQVLDSYENKTYVNGMAGSLYKQAIPLANPTRKPGEWQTYDIAWTAPTFNADESLKTPAYATVFFNGVLVENHFELQGETLYIGKPSYKKYDSAPIKLQAHGDPSQPISFRNIWIRELE